MSHNQLVQRIDNYQSKLQKVRLLSFNQLKKIAWLNKTLSLSTSKVSINFKGHVLHRLLHKDIYAILFISKVTDAIDGIYNANPMTMTKI